MNLNEVIVVDDGSTDNTKAVIAPFTAKFSQKLKYVFQENKGLAAARNTGIRNASGEFIALLDADDYWCRDRLLEGVGLMESDFAVGLVHANVTKVSEMGNHIVTPVRDKQWLSGRIFERLFLRQADISCPTVLFRKACCDKVGLFDENLTRLGCEDRELWLRIAREFKIAYVDKVLAFYRVREGSMSHHQQKMAQARYYVVNKFYPDGSKNPLRKLALARIHKDLGDELLLGQEFAAAKEQYKEALRFVPLSLWPWVNLLKALLRMKIRPLAR